MSVTEQLDRLAAVEPGRCPVVSLYLNTQPGQTGRDQFQTFVRKELTARSRTYRPGSPERESLDRDLERIAGYLNTELQPSANGVAIFACSDGNLFETIQLAAPIDQHWLSIADQPHLYPLARLESRYPRYAAVLADTNLARIFVFATGEIVDAHEVKGVKTKRMAQGGWSQARYQRHIENFHLHHVKDIVDTLGRIVAQENIVQIVMAGDEVVLPLLREQMPKALADKIVEIRLDTHAPAADVARASLEAMARVNAQTDREKVDAAIGAYRAGGLGVVGPEETLAALIKGQVDELLLTARVQDLKAKLTSMNPELAMANDAGRRGRVDRVAAGEPADADGEAVRLADELVTKAKQTAARVTFIEDTSLLADHGGVAALLRFRI
jgi:peptide chain release factor subunit 1